jgi:hypothetical protein
MSVQPPTLVDIHKPPKRDRPEFDLYIGRAQPYPNVDERAKETSKWHNPFTFKEYGEAALTMYGIYIKKILGIMQMPYLFSYPGLTEFHFQVIAGKMEESRERWSYWNLSELTGMQLGCWCITTDSWENPVCHGQVLMKLWHEAWERGELDES